MKFYSGHFVGCPRCGGHSVGRIPRRSWMRFLPGSKHVSCLACNMDFLILGSIEIDNEGEGDRRRFSSFNEASDWYVRHPDGEVYGPFVLDELIRQAAEFRVAPDYKVSTNKKDWFLASDLEPLGMNWVVRMPDGSDYGPVHLNALREMVQEGHLDNDASATHVVSGERCWVGDM